MLKCGRKPIERYADELELHVWRLGRCAMSLPDCSGRLAERQITGINCAGTPL